MTLKADLRDFLDQAGNVLELTDQASKVFKFLSEIVSTVSEHIEQPLIAVDLQCSSRADGLSCRGSIEAKCRESGVIEWHCDICQAAGVISHWQASRWDKQERTFH